MEIYSLPTLRDPIMIAAFQGWNDVGEAATKAVEHLLALWPSQLIAEMESEDFYDYQINRPNVFLAEDGERELSWPTTTIHAVTVPEFDRDLVVVTGVEPSLKWRTFIGELLSLGEDLNISMVISLGALLADVPHTRPIPVSLSPANTTLAKKFDLEMSRYEGQTGILGALQDGCNARDIDALSAIESAPYRHRAGQGEIPGSLRQGGTALCRTDGAAVQCPACTRFRSSALCRARSGTA